MYCQSGYDIMKQLVLGSRDSSTVCNESSYEDSYSLLDKLEVYADKTATNLKAIATVGYPVLVVLLYFNLNFRRHPIDHGHPFVGYTLVFTTAGDETDDFKDRKGYQQSASPSVFPLQEFSPV